MDTLTYWERANGQVGRLRFNNQEDASREVEWDKRSPLCKLAMAKQVINGPTESEDLESRTRTEVRDAGWQIRFRMEFLSKVVAR